MPKNPRYPIPASLHRVEQEIERSRFITTVAPAPTVEEAKAFIARIREEFPDANHNCWAYVVGPPGSTGMAGMSDDGEPHGTAGRPMLTALLHGNVGDVAVVVTRYFGGTLLGWMDEVAFITATRFGRCPFVTVSLERTEFKHPIPSGMIVEPITRNALLPANSRHALIAETPSRRARTASPWSPRGAKANVARCIAHSDSPKTAPSEARMISHPSGFG